MRQSKLTKAARGRECQVRIPGVCNGNPETTVLAHYRLAGTCGVGKKPHDLQGAWCCSACHDACDGRSKAVDRDTARQYHAEGVMRTQAVLLHEGGTGCMSRSIFFMLMCVLVVALFATLCQAGVGPYDSTASSWAIVAIADAMALVGYLWGREL